MEVLSEDQSISLKNTAVLADLESDLLTMLARGVPLAQLLDSLARLLCARGADAAAIVLVDEESGQLFVGGGRNLPPDFERLLQSEALKRELAELAPVFGVSPGFGGRTRRHQRLSQHEGVLGNSELLAQAGFSCWSECPIHARTGDGLGLVVTYHREHTTSIDFEPTLYRAAQYAALSLDRAHSEESLRYRLAFEELITTTSTRFVGIASDFIDPELDRSLRTIGEFADVDRSYIFLLDSTLRTGSNTNEWCRAGVEPQKSRLQNLALDEFPWWVAQLEAQKTIHLRAIDDLPPEAKNEREEFARQNIQSLVAVPMLNGRQLIGFIGFDSVRRERIWTQDEIALLHIVSNIFASVLERKRWETELIRTSKLESLGILAGGIAHDFNNVLMGILGSVSLSQLKIAEDHPVQEKLHDIERAVGRAKDLTHQLLTFSKGGAPVKRTVSLIDLIRETAGFSLTGSSVYCELRTPNSLWPVKVDEGQISQVINNLMLNACQAMPDGGAISVRCENLTVLRSGYDAFPLVNPGKYVKITLTDQGCGIPAEHLNKIFDPFFTTKERGTGLGLATTYSIIKKHFGHIRVESTPEVGTTFIILLPASRRMPISEPKQPRTLIPGEGRILLMDDEPMVRKTAASMLVHLGYEVDLAENGIEAVEAYESARNAGRPFAAVIMDLTVPGGIGGAMAIRQLRRIDPQVRAIVSSGYAEGEVVAEFRKYGFRGVMTKPYEIQRLSAVLNAVLKE